LGTTGLHLHTGEKETNAIKVDILNWTDPFYFDQMIVDKLRLAIELEIASMKLDTISGGGRKKIFGICQNY
jgi:hypothetical protein